MVCVSCCHTMNRLVVNRPPIPAYTPPLSKEKVSTIKVKKVYVIVNPFSGLGKSLRALEEKVIPLWKNEFGIECTVCKTEKPGHAAEYGNTLNFDGYDALCIVGGDGTIHEVVNGMFAREDRKTLPLGILGCGSGNGLYNTLEIKDIEDAARRIGKGNIYNVDAVGITFLNKVVISMDMMGWGMIAEAGCTADETGRWLGPPRFTVYGVWYTLKKATRSILMQTKEKESPNPKKSLGICVCVSRIIGNNMRVCPDALLDDGLFNYVILRETKRGHLLRVIINVQEGRVEGEKFLEANSTDYLSWEDPSVNQDLIVVDGEVYHFEGKIELKCLPSAYQIFA